MVEKPLLDHRGGPFKLCNLGQRDVAGEISSAVNEVSVCICDGKLAQKDGQGSDAVQLRQEHRSQPAFELVGFVHAGAWLP